MSQYARNEAKSNRVTATCCICAAGYEAANELLSIGSHTRILCDSLLLSMSHFCFRCRRPSCPDCWNEAYALCTSCTQATQLPMVDTRHRMKATTGTDDGLLICVKFGSYHQVQQDQEIAHISLNSTSRSISQRDVAQLQKRAMQPPINSSVSIARDRKAHKNISTNTIHGITALDELITVPGPIKRASKKSVVGLGFLISLMLFLVSAVVAANLSTEVNNYLLQTFHIDVRGYFFMLWDWLRRL